MLMASEIIKHTLLCIYKLSIYIIKSLNINFEDCTCPLSLSFDNRCLHREKCWGLRKQILQ